MVLQHNANRSRKSLERSRRQELSHGTALKSKPGINGWKEEFALTHTHHRSLGQRLDPPSKQSAIPYLAVGHPAVNPQPLFQFAYEV